MTPDDFISDARMIVKRCEKEDWMLFDNASSEQKDRAFKESVAEQIAIQMRIAYQYKSERDYYKLRLDAVNLA